MCSKSQPTAMEWVTEKVREGLLPPPPPQKICTTMSSMWRGSSSGFKRLKTTHNETIKHHHGSNQQSPEFPAPPAVFQRALQESFTKERDPMTINCKRSQIKRPFFSTFTIFSLSWKTQKFTRLLYVWENDRFVYRMLSVGSKNRK